MGVRFWGLGDREITPCFIGYGATKPTCYRNYRFVVRTNFPQHLTPKTQHLFRFKQCYHPVRILALDDSFYFLWILARGLGLFLYLQTIATVSILLTEVEGKGKE